MSISNSSSAEKTSTGPSRLGKWRWLLIPSLVFNLLIIGLIGGAFLGGGSRHAHHAGRPLTGLAPFVSALTPRERRGLFREFSSEFKGGRKGMGFDRAPYDRVVALLQTDASIEGRLHAEFADFMRPTAFETLGQEKLITYIENLPAPERKAYAARLKEVLDSPRKRLKRPRRP
ncbi:MAG: periplasmic heavy metal sensor [Halocynthiibacter sp.]